MQPGEMFGLEPRVLRGGLRVDGGVYVVIDAKTEVEFWTGFKTCFGDIAPGCHFEIV